LCKCTYTISQDGLMSMWEDGIEALTEIKIPPPWIFQ